MIKKKVMLQGVAGLFILINLINLLYADFHQGNLSFSVETSYSPGATLQGWVNVSFENQSVDSLIKDSLGNSITLLDLLKLNPSAIYICDIPHCDSDYSASNSETEKTFHLNAGESKLIGFKFDEDLSDVLSVSFVLDSNAQASCKSQFLIDFSNDGSYEQLNNKALEEECPYLKRYGCYDISRSTNNYFVGTDPNKHCQRISLSKSPAFEIGAWISRGNNSGNITAELYTLDGEPVENAFCILPFSSTPKEVSCKINFSVTENSEYYVCIYSDLDGDDSEIRGYQDNANGCGFFGQDFSKSNYAFDIFATGLKFDTPGEVQIKNISGGIYTIEEIIIDYLTQHYGDLKCSEHDCIFPVKILSNTNQEITLKNLELRYATGGGGLETNDFYDLDEKQAKVSSDFITLSLNKANFTLPSEFGNFTYSATLNGDGLINTKIYINQLPGIVNVNPRLTYSGYPTRFKVNVSSEESIVSYTWYFGDGEYATTNTNEVTHTYNSTGLHSLKVEIEDKQGLKSSKNFTISVESARGAINSTLSRKQMDLNRVKTQLQLLPEFDRQEIEKALNFSEIEDGFIQIQRLNAQADTEEEYNNVLSMLLDLEVPSSVFLIEKLPSLPFYPLKESVDVDILANISDRGYDPEKEDEYKDAIRFWMQENLDVKLNYKKYSVIYGSKAQDLLVVFKLEESEKDTLPSTPYLIIKKMENLDFKENYNENEIDGYYYIELQRAQNTFEFATTEPIDFSYLPLFIAPELGRIELAGATTPPPAEKSKKWKYFWIVIAILLVISFITYIFLQEWYKRKYESHLFKDRNNLYNLLIYIKNQKDKGIKEEEIYSSLRKAGWSSEQVKYAIKKFKGERTGMYEIPIDKLLIKFKIKRAEKKQTTVGMPTPRMPVRRFSGFSKGI